MWKKINNARATRQQTPAEPASFGYDSVYDGSESWGGQVVGRTMSPTAASRPLPVRPPREDEIPRALPHLPLQGDFPPAPAPKDAKYRPASSIYSQPSPSRINTKFTNDDYTIEESTYQEDDVSPPSSPEVGSIPRHLRHQDHEVSPIESIAENPRTAFIPKPSRPSSNPKPATSNIPVMRREKKRNQIAAAAQSLVARKEVGDGRGRPTTDPRWDPYSGEITTSDKGKPQSVKPGQFNAQLRPINKQAGTALGTTTSINGPQKSNTSFKDRVQKLKVQNPATEKPGWKGATGRAALVPAVEDQLDMAPISIPRKSSKRVASPVPASPPVPTIRTSTGETSPASARQPETSESTIQTILTTTSGRNSPVVFQSPISLIPGKTSFLAASQAGSNNSQMRGSTPTEVKTTLERAKSAATIERNFREAFKELEVHAEESSDPYIQPPSRFSVTTYASSNKSTPRPSIDTFDQNHTPIPPQHSTSQQSSPILQRKRPKVTESPKATTRKALNSPSSPVVISMTSSISSKRSSNTAKNLPQTPAEVQSLDPITSLQAQLDSLAHRRNQITRSIRQMTEMMPTDNITLTTEVRRKRDAEKLKVEGLREEEADVRRLEHDLGLRLHRAYKRKDKDSAYEPTGLWVRRVTG